jgi:hypothetical protein
MIALPCCLISILDYERPTASPANLVNTISLSLAPIFTLQAVLQWLPLLHPFEITPMLPSDKEHAR